MITAFEIENFKAFKNRQRIPLKPITLIYGPNSAEKSSVIQALFLLEQMNQKKSIDVISIEKGSYSIHYGGFNNYRFNLNQPIVLSLKRDFNKSNISKWERSLIYEYIFDEYPCEEINRLQA